MDLPLTRSVGFRVDFIDGSVRVMVQLKSMIRVGELTFERFHCRSNPELSDCGIKAKHQANTSMEFSRA